MKKYDYPHRKHKRPQGYTKPIPARHKCRFRVPAFTKLWPVPESTNGGKTK